MSFKSRMINCNALRLKSLRCLRRLLWSQPRSLSSSRATKSRSGSTNFSPMCRSASSRASWSQPSN